MIYQIVCVVCVRDARKISWFSSYAHRTVFCCYDMSYIKFVVGPCNGYCHNNALRRCTYNIIIYNIHNIYQHIISVYNFIRDMYICLYILTWSVGFYIQDVYTAAYYNILCVHDLGSLLSTCCIVISHTLLYNCSGGQKFRIFHFG